MTNESSQGDNLVPPPGVAALERSFDRTQGLLHEFREELARLVAKVHHDVERLRETALGGAEGPPWIDPDCSEEARVEQRLAEIVGEEQLAVRTRALVHELMDERFKTLTDLIQTKLARGPNPLQKLGAAPSRRKP
jgi:hypothetical protein